MSIHVPLMPAQAESRVSLGQASARRFDAAAASWDADHGPASARAAEFAVRIGYLRALCRDLNRPRVLDLGCATGQTLLHIRDVIAAGVGVDIAPLMIDHARRNAGEALRLHVGDAIDFCVGCSERFDLVLLVGVLEHLADPAAALDGVKHVLAGDGRLVVIMPHPWGPALRLRGLLVGGDGPPARHLSPLRLRALAARRHLELKAVQALPYAAWPSLVAPHDGPDTAARSKRRNPLAGMLRGAYSAELGHRTS